MTSLDSAVAVTLMLEVFVIVKPCRELVLVGVAGGYCSALISLEERRFEFNDDAGGDGREHLGNGKSEDAFESDLCSLLPNTRDGVLFKEGGGVMSATEAFGMGVAVAVGVRASTLTTVVDRLLSVLTAVAREMATGTCRINHQYW